MLVVPLAGTWIETYIPADILQPKVVVPLAGTWIETMHKKLRRTETGVVPLAGTWIETMVQSLRVLLFPSFPLRERGLKLRRAWRIQPGTRSFPLRERGLKHKPYVAHA